MKKLVSLFLLLLIMTSQLQACSCDIDSTKDDIENDIEDYVSENVDALEALNDQLKNNLKELKNRTNNIEKDEYLSELKNKISKISKSQNIKKRRLLDYRNILFFSNNGIIRKTDELKNTYSIIKSLEDIDISIRIGQGEQ